MQLVTLLGAGIASIRSGSTQDLRFVEELDEDFALCHKHASLALYTLSTYEDYRPQLVADGALRKLVALARLSACSGTVLQSANCLANLAQDDTAATKVLTAREDGEPVLLMTLIELCNDAKCTIAAEKIAFLDILVSVQNLLATAKTPTQ
jgi:hypothetical protein